MRFRKLYADLISESGEVLVVYLAWLRLAGRELRMSGVELYGPDGTRRIVRGRGAVVPQEPGPDGRMEFRLRLRDSELRLEYRAALPPWTPAAPAPPGFRWVALIPRGAAIATWLRDVRARGPDRSPLARGVADTWRLSGQGYVDRVELDAGPRRLGLRTLDWGRAHAPGGTWIYTAARFASGADWRRAAAWDGERVPRTWDAFRLAGSSRSLRLELPEPTGHAPSGPTLLPRRVLHQGAALDPARLPSLVERAALRGLAGRVTETRWLGDLRPPDGGTGRYAALYEHVRFGSRRPG